MRSHGGEGKDSVRAGTGTSKCSAPRAESGGVCMRERVRKVETRPWCIAADTDVCTNGAISKATTLAGPGAATQTEAIPPPFDWHLVRLRPAKPVGLNAMALSWA